MVPYQYQCTERNNTFVNTGARCLNLVNNCDNENGSADTLFHLGYYVFFNYLTFNKLVQTQSCVYLNSTSFLALVFPSLAKPLSLSFLPIAFSDLANYLATHTLKDLNALKH